MSKNAEKLNPEVIKKTADLAKLKLSSEELIQISDQLAKVLNHFDEISAVDTLGIQPLITPTEIEYTTREDIVENNFSAEEMVANAPEKLGHLFKVPPVV